MANNNNYITNNLNGYPSSSSQQEGSRESLDINLASYLLKVKRRWKPALLVFFLTVAAAAVLGIQLKKNYQAEGKLLFKQNNAAALTGLGGEEAGTLKPLLNSQTPLSTQIEVITSDPVLLQTIEKLQLEDEEGNPLNPDDLEKKLNIELVGGTDVIQISYKDEDPEIAAAVVNTLMEVYISEQIRGNQAEPTLAKEFINNQLPQLESNVAKAESALRRFKEANNVIDLQKEAESTVLQIANLNRDIAGIAAQLQGTLAQTSTLQGQLGLSLQQAIALNQVGNSPSVQSIFTELGTTEAELARERQRFQDQHPSIVSLEDKKADLNRRLRQEIRRGVGQDLNISQGLLKNNGNRENQLEQFISLEIQKLNLQRQLASFYQSQQQQLVRAKELPRLETEEQDLLRQVSAAQATYETLLGSLQEVQLVENQQTANARIIENAQLPEEGSSGGKVLLAFGVLLGLLFSNVSVILLEMQDRTLKTVAEIRTKFPHKVLGVIPQESEEKQVGVIVQREPDSFTSELYRMIQANMKFMAAENAPQVILTTSSLPDEGKSTISANLAAAIAQLGRRVLLIDGDLRKPSQHHIWGLSNQFGVKDVVNKTQDFHTAIYQPMAKLDLLTAGEIQSNPLSLLDSPEMSSIVVRARQEYDLILIDAPPLPVTADVLTLAKLVDGILFVSRPGVVEQESAELAIETLTNINKQVIGMVINGVKKKEFDNYSYTAKYAKRYFSKKNSLAERNGSANKPGTKV